jgi:hypothetical protein
MFDAARSLKYECVSTLALTVSSSALRAAARAMISASGNTGRRQFVDDVAGS